MTFKGIKTKASIAVGACVLLVPMLAACGTTGEAPAKNTSIKVKAPTMFRSPSTPKDVLLNFKYAVEHDLLLQRSFYEPEKLRWFLGEYEATANPNNTPIQQVFDYTTTESAIYSSCVQFGSSTWYDAQNTAVGPMGFSGAFGVRLKYTDANNDARRTSLCSQFNADTMQQVFGPPTRVSSIFPPDGSPPPHGGSGIVFGEKSHPLGHNNISYDLSTAKTRRTVEFLVIGNGLIRSVGFRSSQRLGE